MLGDNKLINWPIEWVDNHQRQWVGGRVWDSLNNHKSLMYTTSQQQTETLASSLSSLTVTPQSHFPVSTSVSVQKHNFLFCSKCFSLWKFTTILYNRKLPFKYKSRNSWSLSLQLYAFSLLPVAALIPGPRWNPAALNIPLIDSQVTLVLHSDQHDSGVYVFDFETFSCHQHVVQQFTCWECRNVSADVP